MQVQRISIYNFDNRNSVNKTKNSRTPVFGKYSDVIEKVVKRDLADVADVDSAFWEVFDALKSTHGIKVGPELAILENNGFRSSIYDFMMKFTAPIAKVPSQLRDLVFKAEEQEINLLEKEGVGSLTIFNFGKKGFWGSIFNSQDARSDIKIVFSTPFYDTFELGVTKKGGLTVEQIDYPNWIKSEYGTMNRRSRKSGTVDTTTPIW